MPVVHQNITIAHSATGALSGEIDITDRVIVAIETPSAWTAASINFVAAQVPGGTFVPVVDMAGAEVTCVIAASQLVVLDPKVTRPFRVMKLRSGTTALPVDQAADRVLNVVTIEDDRV